MRTRGAEDQWRHNRTACPIETRYSNQSSNDSAALSPGTGRQAEIFGFRFSQGATVVRNGGSTVVWINSYQQIAPIGW
jgi:hypothetical protein